MYVQQSVFTTTYINKTQPCQQLKITLLFLWIYVSGLGLVSSVESDQEDEVAGERCPDNNPTCGSRNDAAPTRSGGRRFTDEQRLLNALRLDYDKHTRPVYNASHTVHVKLGVTLNQIFDVDERNQVMTTHIWLDQEWGDERLVWDPAEFNGLTTLRVPCHLLWKPDIVLYNSAEDYTEGYMPSLAMVSSNGHVFWPPIVKLRSTCKIDITYFPFDDQTCSLKLGSWAYDGLQVDVLKRDKPIDLTNYVSNGEWELLNVKVIRNVQQYSCCPEPYPDVTFYLHMRRRTLYYTYNVIIPCIMLSCLTLLEFWMPPEGGEKVALGLTVLLAHSVFMLLIAENMPASSFYVPLIGVYIIVVMGLSIVSILCAVVVCNLHHQSIMDRDVPPSLRSFARKINRWVLVSPRRRPILGSVRSSSTSAGGAADLKTPLKNSFSSVNMTFRNEVHSSFEMGYANGGAGRESHADNTQSNSSTDSPLITKTPPATPKETVKRRKNDRVTTDELLRGLNILLQRQEQLLRPPKESDINKEWHEVAEIMDRFLFWLYFIINFVVTIVILVLVPLGKTVNM